VSEWGVAGGTRCGTATAACFPVLAMPRGVEVEASGRAGGARRGGAKVQAQGVVVGGLARGVAQAAAASSRAEQLWVVVSAAAGMCGWAVGGACARGGGGAPRNFIVTRRLCAHAGAMWHPEDHRCAGDLMFYLVAVIARGGARRGAAGGGQRQAVAPGSTSWRAKAP